VTLVVPPFTFNILLINKDVVLMLLLEEVEFKAAERALPEEEED